MNLHLEKCNPPMQVHDLFRDIQDGRILMALLDELSGCKLLDGFKPSSHRIFRLNNIAKVLTFLEERNVKLVSIDAADVADGNSSIVLGLIWNIILFFQIKELTGNIKSQFPSSSSLSSIPTSSDSDTSHSSTPSEERRPSAAARDHGKAIKTLLQWVQRRTRKYGVAVQDFGKSWVSGLAFLAVIKSIDPSLVDMRRALLRSPRENIEEAFRTAHYSLGIPRLLEPEDVTINPPDEQSIMTYVSQFLEHFPGTEEEYVPTTRVSARLNDSAVRNGAKRNRELSYVVRRDWVKSPPKIFISSVSEDSEHLSSAFAWKSAKRAWASEESLLESTPSPVEGCPPGRPLGLDKEDLGSEVTASPPQLSFGDSVANSPDSWSEMPLEKLPESRSSSSLVDSSVGSDLKDPCDASQSNREEPGATEGFVDEGNFSLSSLDSLQAQTQLSSSQGDGYSSVLGRTHDEGSTLEVSDKSKSSNKCAVSSEQRVTRPAQSTDTVKQPSLDLSGEATESGYFAEEAEESTSTHDNEGKSSPEAQGPVGSADALEIDPPGMEPEEAAVANPENTTDCEYPVAERKLSSSTSEEDIEPEELQSTAFNDHEEPHETAFGGFSGQMLYDELEIYKAIPVFGSDEEQGDVDTWDEAEVTPVPSLEDPSEGVHGQETKRDSPEEEEPDSGLECVGLGRSVDNVTVLVGYDGKRSELVASKSQREVNESFAITDGVNEGRSSSAERELERESLWNGSGGVSGKEGGASDGWTESSAAGSSSVSESAEPSGDASPVMPLEMAYYSHYDDPVCEVIEAFGEPNQEAHRLEGDGQPHGHVVTDCSTGEGLGMTTATTAPQPSGSVPLELRLSLSVTPLQPAPAQSRLPDSDTDSEEAPGQLRDEATESPAAPTGEQASAGTDVAAEHCERVDARENTTAPSVENVKDSTDSGTGVDPEECQTESQRSSESYTTSSFERREVEAEQQAPSDLSEVHLILILWVVLYCLLVLPQMDFWALPHLLLNLDD
ncbi:calmin isoform X2 [Denticeps clupeoides]|nr:calmin isoform X2 [Denticeps clupeoides]